MSTIAVQHTSEKKNTNTKEKKNVHNTREKVNKHVTLPTEKNCTSITAQSIALNLSVRIFFFPVIDVGNLARSFFVPSTLDGCLHLRFRCLPVKLTLH